MILRSGHRLGIKRVGGVCGGTAISTARPPIALCCGPCRICSPAARAGAGWARAGAHPGGADFQGRGAPSGWKGRGPGRLRPVPPRQCPGAARPPRPRPIVAPALAYPGTPPDTRAPRPCGFETRSPLLHQLRPLGVGLQPRSQRGSTRGGCWR